MKRILWRVKEKDYRLLKRGKVNLLMRIGYPSVRRVHPRDIVTFEGFPASEFEVIRVNAYTDFTQMLLMENVDRMLPKVDEANALETYQRAYPNSSELGIYVFELCPLEKEMPEIKYYHASKLLAKERLKAFNKVIAESYQLTDWILEDFPDHSRDFFTKYVPGMFTGQYELIACYSDKQNVAVSILRKGVADSVGGAVADATQGVIASSREICTFFVDMEFQDEDVTKTLMRKSLTWLGTNKPVITIPDYEVYQFADFIKEYDWQETGVIEKGYHGAYCEKRVFNGFALESDFLT